MSRCPPDLAVVVPCFNEAEVLPETAKRLGQMLDDLVRSGRIASSSQVCFVDDGSGDQTWAVIRRLQATSGRFSGVRLSRNRGHQIALVAGLLTVPGDVVLSIDADLQDDVQVIPAMLAGYERGADIVCGVRDARDADDIGKRVTARLYYRLLHLLGVKVIFDHADFRLMTRRAIEALREYDEVNLFLRALILQLGFKVEVVGYRRATRFAGTPKYTWRKMFSLALEGITSFSTRPLRLITILGCATSLFTLGLTAWAILAWLAFATTVPGWASTVIPVYLVCSVQLVSIGVIGEYIGKIYLETKRRPRYHVSEVLEPDPSRGQHELGLTDARGAGETVPAAGRFQL